MQTLREEKAKTELDNLRAEMAERRATKSETSEHNTDHKNGQTPDRRAKAKAKTTPSRPEHSIDHKNERTNNRAKPKKQRAGPSPNKNIDTLPKVPPFPTGEKPAGSQDKPQNNNPESEHEAKGNRGRPRNNQGPKPNTQGPKPNTQGPHPVIKDKINKENQIQTQNMTLT